MKRILIIALMSIMFLGQLYAQKKHVEIGELYGDKIEIKSGLQPGDILITDGYNNLYEGQLIATSANG